MTFLPIASSSAGCAYLVTGTGLAPLLIDCGVGIESIHHATGFAIAQLAGVVVSHSHQDHCKSAAKLARFGVDVFGSKETVKAVGLEGNRRGHILEPLSLARVGEWSVLPFTAVHDCPGTLGFFIEGGGGKLLYITDSAYSPYRFDGATIIAAEANFDPGIMRENSTSGEIDHRRAVRTTTTHMSLPRLIDMLKANDLSQVEEIWLLHLSSENSDEAFFKEAVQMATGKVVKVAPRRAA